MSGAREIMERRFIRIRCGTSPREKNAVQSGGRAPLAFLMRLDTDHAFRRTALVLGLSVGRRDLFGTAASIPSGASHVDPVDLYGVIARTVER